jgi:hypothetical protein
MDSTDILVVAGERCRDCLLLRLEEMNLRDRVEIEISTRLHPGDLVIINGGPPSMFLGICGRCHMAEDQDAFEILLDRIRAKAHPEFGSLSWDGQCRRVTETVAFEESGVKEPDDVVRQRALRFLEGLTPEERRAAEVEIVFREERPVRAILKAQTGALSAKRLQEMRARAGLE